MHYVTDYYSTSISCDGCPCRCRTAKTVKKGGIMTQANAITDVQSRRFIWSIMPLMAVVLSGFLTIGIALPVLPNHVHDTLGFGTFTVGLVTGAQFAASLLSRFYAGAYADTKGGKQAMRTGLLFTASGGVFYLLSLVFVNQPVLSVALILVGRATIGGAESFIITGAMTLGLSLFGPNNTGRVIAWVGTAMFAAFASGAPIGSFLYGNMGFLSISIVTVILPLLSMIAVKALDVSIVQTAVRGSVLKTLTTVWLPGMGAALNGVGFSALISFSVLLYAQNGWGTPWLPVSAFAVALIAARLFLGHLIDRTRGWRVGLLFTLVMAAGQSFLWAASSPWIAAFGAAMTGAGWAMVYPAFGAEAVHRVGSQNKGLAMAAYSAFPDLAIGLASPALGLIAPAGQIHAAYFWSAVMVLFAAPVAWLIGKTVAR